MDIETQRMKAKEDSSFGMKFDGEKIDWSLLPLAEIENVIKVLMYGAKKYSPDNWRKVDDGKRRYYNAAMRHLTAHRKGEFFDEETGLSHLAHCACCIIFMIGKEIEEGKY